MVGICSIIQRKMDACERITISLLIAPTLSANVCRKCQKHGPQLEGSMDVADVPENIGVNSFDFLPQPQLISIGTTDEPDC